MHIFWLALNQLLAAVVEVVVVVVADAWVWAKHIAYITQREKYNKGDESEIERRKKTQSETHKMHVTVMRIISSCRSMVPRFSLLSYIKEEKELEINTDNE